MKAKQQPAFPPAIRAVFRAKCPQLQQIPRKFKGSVAPQLPCSGMTPQKMYAQCRQEGYDAAMARKPLSDNPHPAGSLVHACWKDGWNTGQQRLDIESTLSSGNPDKKLLASTSGTITALKSIRETAASWYVVYYGEGDKEVRISKNDPRRRVFDTLEAAEAWASGDAE